jgi:hypothetical protein
VQRGANGAIEFHTDPVKEAAGSCAQPAAAS